MKRRTLESIAKEYVEARGVSEAAALKRSLYSSQMFHGTPMLRIPFFDAKHCPLKHNGIPYEVERPFAEHKHRGDRLDGRKFIAPTGSPNHLYLDPTLAWEELFADAASPLMFTEGPVKAISAHEHNLPPTIALMGVWNWRTHPDGDKERATEPLPELDAIQWAEREVLLVFDSDIVENELVLLAADRLAEELASRGAHVSLVVIPPGKDGEKQGLDDFCVVHGKSAASAFLTLEREEHTLDSRPIILMRDGKLHEVVDQAEEICASHDNVYSRGSTLVRVAKALEAGLRVRQDETDAERRYLDPTQPVIQEYTAAALQLVSSRVARWQKLKKLKKDEEAWVAADPGLKYVSGLLALGEWPHVRPLTGFATTPILRSDGSVHQAPGYDAETGLLLLRGAWPKIPKRPTQGQALQALSAVYEPFAEFPFVEPMHASVVLAAILAGVARHLLPCVPYFHLDAPRQGSGKTALAESLGVIITGTVPATHSFPTDEPETRKKLTSCLLRGDRVILLDNARDASTIDNAILAACITSPIWGDRRLGYTEVLQLPQIAIIVGTGNNNRIGGDMPRRTLKCRIDPDCERPEQRKFSFVPQQFCREHRPELVAAALTVLSAYIQAASPKPKDFRAMGKFEEFDLVRGALTWLDLPDPVLTQDALFEEDDTADDAEIIEEICQAMGDGVCFTIGHLMAEADAKRQLGEALAKIPHDPDASLDRVVAWFFRRHLDQVIRGLKLRRVGKSSPARWQIVKVKK